MDTYDSLGWRTRENTIYGLWTYEYDATGQLTHAVLDSTDPTIPDQDLTYVYDAAGNRIRTIANGVTTEYATNNMNQYTTVGTAVYSYDADGNMMSKVDDIIVFNEEHLRRALTEYFRYYHEARAHLSPDRNAPIPRSVCPQEQGEVIAEAYLGGLHHCYTRAA